MSSIIKFSQFAKVFSLESFPLYGRPLVQGKMGGNDVGTYQVNHLGVKIGERD